MLSVLPCILWYPISQQSSEVLISNFQSRAHTYWTYWKHFWTHGGYFCLNVGSLCIVTHFLCVMFLFAWDVALHCVSKVTIARTHISRLGWHNALINISSTNTALGQTFFIFLCDSWCCLTLSNCTMPFCS